jgi:hypothetical protein
VTKVIILKETQEFKDAINMCSSQQIIALQSRIPTLHTWVVAQKMGKILSQRYPLLSNAIVVVITMYGMMHNTNYDAST